MPATEEPVVSLEGVSYRYPGAEGFALDGVDLAVRRGEFVGVVGPTGAGKSTLCLALNGIVPHFFGGDFHGRALVDGRDTVEHPTHVLARSVGMVLEDPEMQLTAPTALAEVAFALENCAVPSAEIRARAPEALAAVGLAGLEGKHPASLSGGQKQRLAIASALALRPAVLALDEPTSQLDPLGAREVMDLLSGVNALHGVTVLLVSHAVEDLAERCGRVVLLAAGRVVADGPPRRVLTDTGLLEAHGLRPPQLAAAFAKVPGAPLPATFAEALALGPRLEVRPLAPQPAPPEAPAPMALEAVDLEHVYPDGTVALRGVSLAVRRGERVALVGQNGGGKSTLVRHFLRLLEPTAGRVSVLGEDARGLEVSALARRVGYVAQNPDHQLFATTVRAEVAFALERRPDLSKAEVERRVGSALAALRLDHLADRHPLSLAKGDRGRVVAAAVTAMEPEVLVFDEPITGQDHQGALVLLDLTRELHDGGRRTILLVTHHLHLLAGYADRLLVMAGGRLVLDAPLREGLCAADALAGASVEAPPVVRFAAALGLGGGASAPLTPEELAQRLVWREAAAS